jgi:hypothetical protein
VPPSIVSAIASIVCHSPVKKSALPWRSAVASCSSRGFACASACSTSSPIVLSSPGADCHWTFAPAEVRCS